jgi:hypothetical protein
LTNGELLVLIVLILTFLGINFELAGTVARPLYNIILILFIKLI